MLLIGGAARLLAAVCSQGFLASDDHHVVVGAADRIASGLGLPGAYERTALVPGAIAGVMAAARTLGIHDPGIEMMLVRLAQGAFSLLVVYFVYRILAASTADPRLPFIGGLLAAVFYAMPVTSVHQLEESVCQVPLLAAFWWWQRPSTGWGAGAMTGIALGLALILRFPLVGLIGVFVVIALIQPQPVTPSRKIAFLAGLLLIIVLQGYANALLNHEWWYSFKERLGPTLHPVQMAAQSEGYPHSPPWHYLFTLLAALIPPASVLLLAAAVKGGIERPFVLLGAGTLAFFVSHSLIANKQERFLLPILPLLFVLVPAGLPWLAAWMGRWYRVMWGYFWAINVALLVVLTFSFSKKDRVAPLLFIYRHHNATGVLVAQYNQTFTVPDYYLGRPRPMLAILQRRDTAVTAEWVRDTGSVINYVILYSDTPEADRVFLANVLHKNLSLLTTIAPSLTDRIAHAINPRHNKARPATIYTTT